MYPMETQNKELTYEIAKEFAGEINNVIRQFNQKGYTSEELINVLVGVGCGQLSAILGPKAAIEKLTELIAASPTELPVSTH